jgi:hypothetical protein
MTGRPIAVVRSTADLRAIFRQRVRDLNISFETVDSIAGLPTRDTGKLLGPNPSKNFGAISFDALLGALGLKLVAVEDAEALERIRPRLVPLQRIDRSAASRQENHRPHDPRVPQGNRAPGWAQERPGQGCRGITQKGAERAQQSQGLEALARRRRQSM